MPDQPLRPHRGTKIAATLGPASASPETIDRMVAAGLDLARLNFSHADHDTVAALAARVRDAQRSSGRPLAILADLQGPKLRIGELPRPRALREGDPLRIETRGAASGEATVSCDYEPLTDEVTRGALIYLRDGSIELEVTSVDATSVETLVRRGGELTSRAGMNVPDLDPQRPALTEQDLRDLRFAVEQGMDYIALSFVRRADDLRLAREAVHRHRGEAELVAKIETRAALDQLDAIADEADALMVARGDLGAELGPEHVPPWQRRIIDAARRRRIPSIVATEMLESMRDRPRPTRAEASDVAHAAWEGADAVMLSAESAVGSYPVESVAMMDRILHRAEAVDALPSPMALAALPSTEVTSSIARAVRELLRDDPAIQAVVAFTVTGSSARLVAADRPMQPVLALTRDPGVRQRLALVRGVQPVLCEPVESEAQMLAAVEREARRVLPLEDGATVAIVGAMPVGDGGAANFVSLHTLDSQ